MTGKGHHAVGIGAALMSYAALIGRGYEEPMALIAAWAVLPGATAPDWLEISRGGGKKRRTLITHRTLTHWLPLWIGVFLWTYHQIGISAHYGWFIAWGFSVGALVHLLVDVPNPLGIPIMTPWHRVSLGWWRSGEMEALIITVFAIGGILSVLSAHGMLHPDLWVSWIDSLSLRVETLWAQFS